jgi:hypothetical protein
LEQATKQEIARFEDDLAADMLGPPPNKRKPSKRRSAKPQPPNAEAEEANLKQGLYDDALDAPIADEIPAIVNEEAVEFKKRSYRVSKRNQRRRDEDAKNVVHGMGVTALKTITIFGLLLTTVYVMQLIGICWLKTEAVAKIETIITYGWTVYFAGIVTQFVTVAKPQTEPQS